MFSILNSIQVGLPNRICIQFSVLYTIFDSKEQCSIVNPLCNLFVMRTHRSGVDVGYHKHIILAKMT